MNKPADNSVDARNARGWAVANWFCLSFLMLAIPMAELWRLGSPSIPPWLLLVAWGFSGVFGLLCGVRSFRLADKKSAGFGILAVLLHIGSLLLLGFIIVVFNSAG